MYLFWVNQIMTYLEHQVGLKMYANDTNDTQNLTQQPPPTSN